MNAKVWITLLLPDYAPEVYDFLVTNGYTISALAEKRPIVSNMNSHILALRIKGDDEQHDSFEKIFTDFLWKARKKINQSDLGHKEKSAMLRRITDEEYRHSELNRKDFMELLMRK